MPKAIPYSTDLEKLTYIEARVVLGSIKAYKGSACWIWTGPKTKDNYGQYRFAKKTYKSHREMYTICVGPIPEGLEIDHLCCNRLCCNPLHLEAVTHAVNIRRSRGSGNWAKEQAKLRTHCPSGHEFTPENTEIRHHPNKNNPNSNRNSRRCKGCIKIQHAKSVIAVREKRRKLREAKLKANA